MSLPNELHPLQLAASSGGGYEIEQSLRFNQADSNTLTRTPSSSGNLRTGTISFWIKKSFLQSVSPAPATQMSLLGCQGNGYFLVRYRYATDRFTYGQGHAGNTGGFESLAEYRDPSAWHHICLVNDFTNATTADMVRLYINGVRQDVTITSAYTNADGSWNSANLHYIGWQQTYFEGYMAEFHNVDGTALDPDQFGELDDNGVWRPIAYTGSYGTNGFYLKFDPSATNGVGHDHSDRGNHWTANNFDTTNTTAATYDVMSDTPTNNFATLNPLEPASASAGTLSDGNLYIANQDYSLQKATFRFGGGGPTTGKYYWEVTHTGGNYTSYIGVTSNLTQDAGEIAGGDKSWFGTNSTRKYDTTSGSYTHTYSSGDVHGYAIDLDAQEIKYYINGTLKFTDSTLPDPATTVLVPFQFTTNSGGGASWTNTSWNFGQRAFSHQPTGYSSLCTANLPAATVKDGSEYFNTVTYTGTQGTLSVTGVGFQPDFVWIKNRGSAVKHMLFDSIRNVLRSLSSDNPDQEAYESSAGYLSAFDTDGFTVVEGTSSGVNWNNDTFVSWNWDAGGSGSSNTDGSITSTVSANPTAGFSIVSYTGTGVNATIGHGLGVAPTMMIIKDRDAQTRWIVYHQTQGNAGYLRLDTDAAFNSDSTVFNSTSPSSTVFSVGTSANTNPNGNDIIAYCFAEIESYSKFGSYVGNGSDDGPFVYCGFRPAFVMFKKSDNTGNWWMFDTARNEYNYVDKMLAADADSSESGIYIDERIDILSNGFKLRDLNTGLNANTSTYIFMALAEHPFGGSGVSPATAR